MSWHTYDGINKAYLLSDNPLLFPYVFKVRLLGLTSDRLLFLLIELRSVLYRAVVGRLFEEPPSSKQQKVVDIGL